MPAALTYPGVYIEEIPSGVRTITGVATSITAFIGRAHRGPVNEPVRVQSFAEFERAFGGLWVDSTLGYAVADFFRNGGGDALIVRVINALTPATAATAEVGGLPQPPTPAVKAKAVVDTLSFIAVTAGIAGDNLSADIEPPSGPGLFDLIITDGTTTTTYKDCTILPTDPAFVGKQLADDPSGMALLDWNGTDPIVAPDTTGGPEPFTGGADQVLNPPKAGLKLVAASPGKWGNNLVATIDASGLPIGVFNLSIQDSGSGASENFLNLALAPNSARFVTKVLERGSNLVRTATGALPVGVSASPDHATLSGGDDGDGIDDNDILGNESDKSGIYALEKADLFNLLCIPPIFDPTGNVTDLAPGTRTDAAKYCEQRRAMFVADPSNTWTTHSLAIADLDSHMDPSANAALFFPMLRAPDPLREGQIGEFAPCGAVAGVMARTDATRGVWKAPAGIEATLNGVSALSVKLTDGENGQLNPLGVNCLRSFPVIGRVVWGSRTRRGADQLASEWKYLPVRRLALFLEESLYRGTQWVVFEPNDEPLWAQIRLNIGAFMHNLFRQGAFQGMTPRDAYFVKCNKDTTTQNDIDLGIVNIVVGFAPLKPAEFVVIKIQQIAGQIQT